jgi:hypothetical protein
MVKLKKLVHGCSFHLSYVIVSRFRYVKSYTMVGVLEVNFHPKFDKIAKLHTHNCTRILLALYGDNE